MASEDVSQTGQEMLKLLERGSIRIRMMQISSNLIF